MSSVLLHHMDVSIKVSSGPMFLVICDLTITKISHLILCIRLSKLPSALPVVATTIHTMHTSDCSCDCLVFQCHTNPRLQTKPTNRNARRTVLGQNQSHEHVDQSDKGYHQVGHCVYGGLHCSLVRLRPQWTD